MLTLSFNKISKCLILITFDDFFFYFHFFTNALVAYKPPYVNV